MEKERFIMWLNKRRACEPGMNFVMSCESFEEFYETCADGGWLIWLFERTASKLDSILVKARMTLMLDELSIINERRREKIIRIIELCESGNLEECFTLNEPEDMIILSVINVTNAGPVSYFSEMYDSVDDVSKFLSLAASKFREMVPIDSIKRPWND